MDQLNRWMSQAPKTEGNVNNAQGCNNVDRLIALLDEDSMLYAREQAYERHSLPVPDEITKRRTELKGAIECAWREQLDRLIAVEERCIEELRSREEKRENSERELARLKALREG
jgi:hypothetical protein